MPGCPIEREFDPLDPAFLADPFAVLDGLDADAPVFCAPSIDYYVVTRYADIDAVFRDDETHSAAADRPDAALQRAGYERLREQALQLNRDGE